MIKCSKETSDVMMDTELWILDRHHKEENSVMIVANGKVLEFGKEVYHD